MTMQERIDKENSVTQQLRIIFKAIQAHSKQVQKTCGLSSVRLWMLYEISQNQGVTVSELAVLMSIHRSTCSNMLDKLEDQELIYRNRSKTDQRTVRLHITDTGRAILAKAPSPPEGKLSSSLHKLTEEQLANLDNGLSDLIEVLHYDDKQAGLTPIQSS